MVRRHIIFASYYFKVSARELHERLGIKKDFTNWFKQQQRRANLVEGRDFILLVLKDEQDQWGGHNKVDYMIPIDIGKHLCMMSGVFGK